MKHAEYQKKANGYGELERIPLDRLTTWMSKKLELTDQWIEEFERQYRGIVVDGAKNEVVGYLTEAAAWERLFHLGCSRDALRKYCVAHGRCEATGEDVWTYQEGYVLHLAEEWIRASEVRDRLRRSRSRFYQDIRDKGWATKRIGRVLLLRKADVSMEMKSHSQYEISSVGRKSRKSGTEIREKGVLYTAGRSDNSAKSFCGSNLDVRL